MGKIFAYTGSEPCRDRLTDGLCLSGGSGGCFGTAIAGENGISLFTAEGTSYDLKTHSNEITDGGYTGLAVYSQHSKASPHTNGNAAAAVEGFVENLNELKKGLDFISENEDAEAVLLELLNRYSAESGIKRLAAAIRRLEGNPTAAVIFAGEDAVYCRAGESPLAVGICTDGIALSSELYALSDTAKRYFTLENGEYARITRERATVYNSQLKRIKKQLYTVPDFNYRQNPSSLGEELFCLPLAVREALKKAVNAEGLRLSGFNPTRHSAEKIKRIIFTGSGTAFNAAAAGAAYTEELTDIPCTFFSPAELRYSPKVFDRGCLIAAVSFSGEESDTFACVMRAREFGAKSLCITGSPHSYLARCCDTVIPTGADYSESVYGVQAYADSLLTLCFFALRLGSANGIVSDIYLNVALKMAEMLPGKVSASLKRPSAELINAIQSGKPIVFTGLCADLELCREAAEKIRKITGVTAYSVPIDGLCAESTDYLKSIKTVAVITNRAYLMKTVKYLTFLKSLQADITVLTGADTEDELHGFESVVSFPESLPLFNGITAAACVCGAAAAAKAENEEEDGQQVG